MDKISLPSWTETFLREHRDLSDFTEQIAAIVPVDVEDRQSVIERLRQHLLEACYCASRYEASKDPHADARNKIHSFNTERQQIENSVADLKSFFIRHPQFMPEIGATWFSALKDRGISLNGEKTPSEYLITCISALETAFAYDFLGGSMTSGERIHRRVHGCIRYKDPINSGRLPSVITMLAFHLVLIIRKASRDENIEHLFLETMPVNGDSHYPLVTCLINATFDIELDEANLKSRLDAFLKRNNDARFCSWP
ncbi:hypothetical protein [Noviherbaspirillum autotrophicum]|uniref:Uncharacterized protein n=1 Tax=Noviherbaspirillum autotrophicum TaxID=709839 RepID=A0A0C1Y6C1_9BURK|nr:hypothetical protein [Noviherbaspirillum autotrophicum]KIF82483.1 hypothetical protein TSA66_19345 [Noviherbaspirillum autotrophicum]